MVVNEGVMIEARILYYYRCPVRNNLKSDHLEERGENRIILKKMDKYVNDCRN
jgi:hypothetical protein